MESYDPDTLTAILSISLDDGVGYAQNLRAFTNLMVQAKTKGLPEPYSDMKTIFLFETMPTIVNKVMDIYNAEGDDLNAIVNFIKEAIGIIIWSYSAGNKTFKIIHVLSKILDPSQNFYAYNGRTESSAYSTYLTTFAQHFKSKFGIMFLLNFLSKPTTTADDLVKIMDVLKKTAKIIGSNVVFDKKEKISSDVVAAIKNCLTGKKDREIPHKQICSFIESIIECFSDDNIINETSAVITHFVDTELAEVKLSGFRLCALLFTKGMSTLKAEEEPATELLIHVISKIESLEALQVLKPALLQLAKHAPLKMNLLQAFFHNVMSQHASILPAAINIFADVVLAERYTESPLVFTLPTTLPTQLLGRLLEGRQFIDTASLLLWSQVESDPTIIDTLTAAASKSDLGSLLPNVDALAAHEGMSAKCANFVDAILKKSSAPYNPAQLIDCCIKSGIDSQTVKQLVSIVSKTKTTFSATQITEINKQLDDATACSFFRMLLPERINCLAADDSQDSLVKIVEEAGLARFDILDHAYHNVPYSNTQPQTIAALVLAADKELWKFAMEDNEQARELLLEVREPRELPTKLVDLVQRAMESLKESPKGALILALKCIQAASEFVTPESLGFIAHKYDDPEDTMEITIRYKSEKYTLKQQPREMTTSTKPLIASIIGVPVPSLVLYHNKSCLKPCEIKELNPPEIEVRTLNEYDPPAVFTEKIHPINAIIPHYKELFELLSGENATYAFNVLNLLPTPADFKIEKLTPDVPYVYLYQLHYIAKHQEECKEIIGDVEKSFIESFDILLPESRYIMSTLLTGESAGLISPLKSLIKLPDNKAFEKIANRILKHIENCEVELDNETLTLFLFDDRKSFVEELLKTKLIKFQKFVNVLEIFEKLENKIPHVFVITKLNPPVEFAERITNILTPLFETLNPDVIECLAALCKVWPEFPVDRFSETLIDGFIRCTRKEVTATEAPFSLLSTMISRDEKFKDKVIEELKASLPKDAPWGYAPSDKERSAETNRCGLNNLGATCYVNSVLQQLFAIEPFRNYIINTQFDDSGLIALHKLFTQMMYSQNKSVEMQFFARDWKDWDGNSINPREQQDANEFLMYVLTKLEGTPAEAIFRGVSSSNIQGVGEDFSTSHKEPFTILPLEVSGQKDFKASISLFGAPETITDYRADGIDHPITVNHFTTIDSLPDHLIIQLKRFEFSVETGLRTKIDSVYNIPEVAEINGVKYDLTGVVVHQGDAEAGHYFSYTKEKQWICLNDVSTTFAKEENFKETCSGALEFGTSGYLLFYIKQGITQEAQDLHPEKELVDEINAENRRLLADRIYFSPEFCSFVCDMASIETCHEFIFSYYTQVLSHSSSKELFEKMTNCIINLIENGALDSFQSFILSDVHAIADIMINATPKENRENFAKVMKLLFTKIPVENDLIVLIISQIQEWTPLILEKWRVSFDIFQILEDFASIDDEHAFCLDGFDIPQILIDFVKTEIPAFVNNKSNCVPVDRFKKISDCSHILNTINILGKARDCLVPQFMKWIIGSEKNVDALVKLFIENKIKNISRIINDCGVPASEDLVLSLAAKTDFNVPSSWLSSGFLSSNEAEGRLARALSRAEDPTALALKQPQLMANILFSPSAEARQDAMDSLKARPNEKQFDALAPLVEGVPNLSKQAYSQANKQSALPFDMFPAHGFLSHLLLLLPKAEGAYQYCSIFGRAIINTLAVGGLYDYHLTLLIQLYCNAARMEGAFPEIITPQVLDAIRSAVDKFPENMTGRDDTVRAFFLLLAEAVSKTRLSADELFGEGIKVLSESLFTMKLPTSSRAAIQLTEEAVKRYATSAKMFKTISIELHKTKEISAQLYEFYSMFKDDVIKSNMTYILSHPESIKILIQGVSKLTGHEKFFTKAIIFMDVIAHNATHQLDTIVHEEPMLIKPFFRLVSEEGVEPEARHSLCKIITYTFEYCKPVLETLYGDTIITKVVPPKTADEYVSSLLLLLLKLWIDDIPSDFIQTRIGNEIGNLFLNCKDILDIRATLHTLTEVMDYVEFEKMQVIFETIDNLHCLHVVWGLKPIKNAPLSGLLQLTNAICAATESQEEKDAIIQAAKQYESESNAHKDIIESISSM